ncbi:hypothetical protein CK203_055690 [Vitis vinifera]|uniref:Uncharacterized protein n=1 Tax=Vitis vinifera TaxID=29760 RepID=A0A438FVA3_VITVI|nr:hypothetical protein CK203_055690 [Vitis vinifera]
MECWERYMEAINACPHHGFDTWLLGMDEPNKGEVGKTKSQPNALNAKAVMYTLNEDCKSSHVLFVNLMSTWWRSALQFQLLGKCLEINQMSLEIQANNNASYGNTYTQIGGTIQISPESKSTSVYTHQPAQPSQQASNLEQAIVNLSKVVGDFVGDKKSINAQLSQRIDSVENTLNKRMDGCKMTYLRR